MAASEGAAALRSNPKAPLAAGARLGYRSRPGAGVAPPPWDRESESMVADISDSGVAAEELRQFIERIETLEEEKRVVAEQIKDVMAEAKARGFDTKAMRTLVRLRAKKPQEREEEEAILDLYKSALGMV
jgi:uncharacterized protein (UPF0335 family)